MYQRPGCSGGTVPGRAGLGFYIRGMYRRMPLVAVAVFCTMCGTETSRPLEPKAMETPKPKVKLEGWKDVAGGKMGPDGLFYSETGRFFAAFPGMPEHHSKDIESGAGRLRMESYVYEESATLAYMVAYTDYPSKYVNDVGWQDFLRRAQAGALQALEIAGTPKSEDVLINGYHGVKYRANSEGQFMVSQFLLVGNRLFQTTILSDGSYPADVLVDQFINGFHMVTSVQEVEDWWPTEMDSLDKAAGTK